MGNSSSAANSDNEDEETSKVFYFSLHLKVFQQLEIFNSFSNST